MCLEIYVHCTTREHDTRRLSVLNPITGYTVYSPWQEPHNMICDYPHITEQIDVNQRCHWHPRCCRLEHHRWCWSDNCSLWSKYHHFVDERNGEIKDISFLGIYKGYNPTNLFLAGWFFKSGVELWFSNHHLGNSPIIVEGSSYAAGLANAGWLRTRLVEIATMATECLGQFAILWDLNSGPGALPPRPGCEADPRLNERLSRVLCLRVAESGRFLDTSPVPWPHYIQLWDKFRAGIVPLRDDPYTVPWITGPSGVKSNPESMFSTVPNLNGVLQPEQHPPEMIYNPGMPYIYPTFPPHVASLKQEPESLLNNIPMDTLPTPPSTPTPFISTLPGPTLPTDIRPMDTLLSPYSPIHSATTPLSPLTTPMLEENMSISPIPNSVGDNIEPDGGDDVPNVDALVGHDPPHAARRAVQWYKVRWEGDWGEDKETWERVINIPP
ncbi:hypothetical protein F4813DRAFT_392197 [Daldinia decipiens]|uniref:uncharacterized protein n=1 Tax=Daldinia decipiens TaxID=326647 RepID=UPI0020C58D89|nr:uncharacterized protein F4813DRAFT_392197 [Daldinia decipiens]KAI1654946.1 hypothetical protein F4813DRAFT_392197 [Daldinia decipiens]